MKLKAKIAIVLGILFSAAAGYYFYSPEGTGGGVGFGRGAMFSSTAGVTDSFVSGTLTQGGGVTATSTSGTVVPLLSTDFDSENVIDVTLNVQDATLSFPASSTLSSFIPTSGQVRTLYVRNATTTATMDLTISGGTGVLFKNSTSTAVLIGDTDGSNYAKIDLIRKSDTDIEALLTLFID